MLQHIIIGSVVVDDTEARELERLGHPPARARKRSLYRLLSYVAGAKVRLQNLATGRRSTRMVRHVERRCSLSDERVRRRGLLRHRRPSRLVLERLEDQLARLRS